MENEKDKSGTQDAAIKEAAPVQFDEFKLKHYLQEVRDNQNLGLAIIGGAGAAAIGAIIWGLITELTGYQVGWMAVGIGYMVGFAVRHLGKGVDVSFAIVGGAFSLLGCLAGNLFSICIYGARGNNLSIFEVFSVLDFPIVADVMKSTFSVIDALFYIIAIYEGYKYSQFRIPEEDLARLTK